MTITTIPDAEQLVVQYLLAQAELDIDGHIYTVLPKDTTIAVRVHQFGDVEITPEPLWLVRSTLQVDVWGGPKKTTHDIAATVRGLLRDRRIIGAHDEGVVTKTRTQGWDTTPDQSFTPARPRVQFLADIWTRPATTVGS